MSASEPFAFTQERRKRAAEMFPALGDTDAGTQLQIDNWVSAGNGTPAPVSDFTQLATALGRHAAELSAPEPDVPDVAPNVAGWEPNQPDPRDPYGIRAPYQGPPEGYYGASSSPGETLRNVAGVFNPFSENSVFGSFYQGENPVLQELLRPANYVGAGGGVRGLARGALSGIGGRVAGEAAMEAVPEDAPLPLRIGAGLAGGLVGGVAGYRAIDDVPRLARTSATWMEAADNALAEASGATEAAIRRQAPEAFQAGRVPGTDELFTFGPQGESVGPTGNVYSMRFGRGPVVGPPDVTGRPTMLEPSRDQIIQTNLGRAYQEGLAAEERAAFQSAYERSIAGAERGIGGGANLAPTGSSVEDALRRARGGAAPEGFSASRSAIWDDVSRGILHPEEVVPSVRDIAAGTAQPRAFYRAVSDAELEAAQRSGRFSGLVGNDLYVTPDPDRIAGGAYGAKGSGAIVEFDPNVPVRLGESRNVRLEELLANGDIPMQKVRRIWKWDESRGDHLLSYERPAEVEDALRAAREGEPPRVGGGADVPGEPPMVRGGKPGDDAVQALRDALDAEVALRKSGQIANEISAGRSRQAGRIASGLEAARGGTLEERIQIASGAARGQLRETFQQPLELTQDQIAALADRLQDTLAGAGPDTPSSGSFEQLNGLRALNALVKGENVQPAQLKLLQRVFGDDIAGLAERATIGRRAWKAGLDEAAGTRVERAARFGEKQIARYEEQAIAQFKLADDLTERLNLDPTNPQLKDAVTKARQAGEMAQMRADDLLARRAAALEGDPADALESLARQRKANEGVAALREAEAAQRAGKELTPEQDALIRSRDIVGRKLAISSPKAKEVMNAVDALQKGDRAILDAIKNDRPFYRGMQAWLTGDIADSFLSAALQRRALASTVLERKGVQPEIAHKMASTLFDAELQRHYNGNVPESAKRMLQDAMRAGAQDADLMPRGLELLVQRAKNTMFGLGDFGVLGVQGLNALRRGSLPLLTGTINRGLAALHLPHVSTVVDDVDRMTQYAIDGLHLGTGPSMARPDAGTLFSYLGRPGRTLDEKVLNRAGNAMNEVQFGKILGTMRNLDHEGNLVMLKMLGRDISNPTVRAQAAQNANTLTSFARTALSGNRRAIETIGLTSPSMTRARINSIKEMANLINPKASTEQRIMAASMLFSTYVIYAGVAKALNDAIGTGELEMEPGKKGFGMIRSRFENKNGQNILIDVIPQDSVERAFAQSIEALRDPNVDDIEIQRAWEKVMLGSGSIVTRGAAAGAFRTGFEPGKGYRFGNLSGEGMVKSVLPIPPSVQSLAEGATTPLEIGLTAAGISNYPDAGGGGTSRARPTRATPSRQRPTRSSR